MGDFPKTKKRRDSNEQRIYTREWTWRNELSSSRDLPELVLPRNFFSGLFLSSCHFDLGLTLDDLRNRKFNFHRFIIDFINEFIYHVMSKKPKIGSIPRHFQIFNFSPNFPFSDKKSQKSYLEWILGFGNIPKFSLSKIFLSWESYIGWPSR